jgi:hypothetical protein
MTTAAVALWQNKIRKENWCKKSATHRSTAKSPLSVSFTATTFRTRGIGIVYLSGSRPGMLHRFPATVKIYKSPGRVGGFT